MHFSFIAKAVPNFSHWFVSLQTEVEKMQYGSHLLEGLRLVDGGNFELHAGVDVLVDVKIGDPALHDLP